MIGPLYQGSGSRFVGDHPMSYSSSKASKIDSVGLEEASAPSIVQRAFQGASKSAQCLLEPIERISEVLFGLIMVLTITCSFSIAEADRKKVSTMLLGALGCNLAWEIIDGFMYLMACFSSRGQNIIALKALRNAPTSEEAHEIISNALPPLIRSLLSEAELESLRQKLNQLPDPPPRPRLAKKDWLGGLGVFLLVSLSTFPVVMPFIGSATSSALERSWFLTRLPCWVEFSEERRGLLPDFEYLSRTGRSSCPAKASAYLILETAVAIFL
jgi:hypothetical protein